MKASPAARPNAPAEETMDATLKLVWQPPPLRIERGFLLGLDALLMESCRDTVDAVVIAYKRDHEKELAAPGGADQLLAFYSDCKEKIVPQYIVEIRQKEANSFTPACNLSATLPALDGAPRGDIVSIWVTTRGAKVTTSLYFGNRMPGQSQLTVTGANALVSTRMMKSIVELMGRWRIGTGFTRSYYFAILLAGTLQSSYLFILFQLWEGARWLPVLGMISVGFWAAMAVSFALAFPPVVFHIGKPPDSTRRCWLVLFLLINLIFWIAITAAILFPL